MITIWIVALLSLQMSTPTVFGKWKTIDDQTGKALAVVEIYEQKGKVYGKVVEILNEADRTKVCVHCTGSDKNKPILGLQIIKGLSKDGKEYNGGKILDPKTGKLYSCYITNETADKLKVRGFLGVSLLGRTQYWHRIK